MFLAEPATSECFRHVTGRPIDLWSVAAGGKAVSDNISARVSEILLKGIVSNGERSAIGTETPLLSAGLDLDSVAVLELILAVESEFGIEFADDELSVALFDSVGALARTIEEKLAAHSTGASAQLNG